MNLSQVVLKNETIEFFLTLKDVSKNEVNMINNILRLNLFLQENKIRKYKPASIFHLLLSVKNYRLLFKEHPCSGAMGGAW